ncbi:MAG: hypothetical protein PHD48_01775 [Alphaproteobacteria bacterium]|nr:hypothetical protein [Alphaproteobacteria bacterium]
MRFKGLMIIGVLLTSLPFAVDARVLLPEDNTSQDIGVGNLGLVPRQTSEPKTTAPKAVPAAPETPQTTSPPSQAVPETNTVGFDSVNADAIQSIDISILRKAVPELFNDVSDSDIKKLFSPQLSTSRNKIAQKYLKTNPQTGQVYIDFMQIQKDKAAENAPAAFVPGGKVTTSKTTAEQDRDTANLLAQGKMPQPVFRPRKLKFMEKPPMLLTSKDLPIYDSGMLEHTLNVSIFKDYTWGVKDAQKITDDLGYTEEAIPTNCQLRLDATLHTDDEKDLYGATIMTGNTKTIPYSGVLKTIKARPYAVCNKPEGTLPLSGSIILKYHDKYAIMLSEANCTLASKAKQSTGKPPSSLVVQYSGDSNITCTFMN